MHFNLEEKVLVDIVEENLLDHNLTLFTTAFGFDTT